MSRGSSEAGIGEICYFGDSQGEESGEKTNQRKHQLRLQHDQCAGGEEE